MKDEARVKNAEERKKEFESKVLEKKRKKEENKEAKQDKMTVDAQGGGGDGSRGEKRKADDYDIDAEMLMGQVEFDVIEERAAEAWVCEVNKKVEEMTDLDVANDENEATDNAADTFSEEQLAEARGEEIQFMEKRSLWEIKPTSE